MTNLNEQMLENIISKGIKRISIKNKNGWDDIDISSLTYTIKYNLLTLEWKGKGFIGKYTLKLNIDKLKYDTEIKAIVHSICRIEIR